VKNGLMIIILVLIVKSSSGQQFADLHGDYFGQTPPGNKAVKFAPGIISLPDRSEYKIVFSPDGKFLFFVHHNESGDKCDIYWVSTKVIDEIRKCQTESMLNIRQ
jgi:hypothetical protein